MIVGSNILAGASGQGGNYLLNRSVRLRSSATAYFNRTPASASNRKIWTWSGWVKRGILGSGSEQALFTAGNQPANTYDTFTWLADLIRFTVINAAAQRILVTTQSVFRDPSAWYHVVIAIDTTQAVSTNGVRIWVNNVLQPLTVTAYTQNQDCTINSTSPHYLGVLGGYASSYFDGYLTEVNFIDGQALTPTSFGEYNTITGVWQPKKYVGTYGTNGFYLPFNLQNTSSYAASFNGSSQYVYLNNPTALTLGSNSFTIESWVYLNSASQTGVFYDGRPSGTQGAYPVLYFAAGVLTYYVNSNALISGTSPSINQWHHVAVVRNGTTTTMYLDGVSQGSATDTTNYLSGGATRPIIGMTSSVGAYFNGLLSNFRVVNGSAVYTSNFVPSSVPLTAITNTALLTFQNATIVDNSTNAYTITNVGSVITSLATPFVSSIGSDASGNNNNWFANNINVATAGATYDSMTDVPTLTSATQANYCVLNPLAINGSQISSGNLNLANSATAYRAISSFGMTSGKWYWEATTTIATYLMSSGIWKQGAASVEVLGYGDALSWGWYANSGQKWFNTANTAWGSAFTSTNDVLGVAFNADTGDLFFYKNGVLQGGGAAFTGLTSGPYFAGISANSGGTTSSINFGQRPFAYTPPTGFVALNTYNLPTPTIANGANYMNAIPNSGTGTTRTDVVAFQPDLVWTKTRNTATNGFNIVQDSVRGAGNRLITDGTYAEAYDVNYGSFNSTGFTFGSNLNVNTNGNSYIDWFWKAGGTAVTNTSGSITSSVSANTTAGFSIVTYTGTGANATVGHGLGVAPKMVIIKGRTTTYDWRVWFTGFPTGYDIQLNQTAAYSSAPTVYTSAPTSTVINIGTGLAVNQSAATYVAYCWAEIPGFSKFGSYTGNGSTDGPFVYLGFRPRFILAKRTNAVSDWWLYDTSRNTYNVISTPLFANLSNAEGNNAVYNLDLLSNGFKWRTADTTMNGSGSTYIYAAFAENPFNYSLAR